MEIYTLNNEKSYPIKIDGKYTLKIKEKHIKSYGEVGSKNIFNNALEMFEKSLNMLRKSDISNNILIVGKVQSGKTSNLEMFTALAFDNGYNAVIIYGGYDTTLLQQTINRFKETFDIHEQNFDSETPALFATDDSQIDDLDEDILDEIFDVGKPVIFVSMKRPVALNRINSMLKNINLGKVNAFIIDDEGDQASLNTQFKKQKKSPTYDAICNMKSILNDPLYLSVTATPQANIFQYEMSELCPSEVKLIAPGNGYTGAEPFHLREENISIIDEIQENAFKLSKSLRNAFHYFVISSAIMIKRNLTYSDMIIHTDRSVNVHSELYTTLNSKIEDMKDAVKSNNIDLTLYLNEIKEVYNTEYFSKDILTLYEYDELINEIKQVISKTFIVLQNSKGKETMSNANYKRHKIYIGGDLLQRGVTFKYLVATYFTRWAKSGNMDTVLQRCRWFGYRGKYLDLCKIFTTEKIMNELSGLATTENDLWNQFYSVEKGELALNDIIIDADESTLNPTRKNIGKYKKVTFRSKWHNQRFGVFDVSKINHNNSIFAALINEKSLNWISTDKGRTDGKVWTEYCYISKNLLKILIDESHDIFDMKPFNKKILLKDLSTYPIVVIKMFNDENKFRERSFSSEYAVSALQQGADKVDENERKYLGDSSVIVDDNAINIQIFKILPKKYNSDYLQYMISIHFPQTKTGFIKEK